MSKLKELLSKIISKLNVSVKTEEQHFSDEEKAQARENIGILQADMTQNDNTKSDYIKNRLAWVENVPETIGEQIFSHTDEEYVHLSQYGIDYTNTISIDKSLVLGERYRVYIDSNEYDTCAVKFKEDPNDGEIYSLGNQALYGLIANEQYMDTDEDFFITIAPNVEYGSIPNVSEYIVVVIIKSNNDINTSNMHSVTVEMIVETEKEIVHQIDPKFYESLTHIEEKTITIKNNEEAIQAPFSELVGLKIVDRANGQRRFLTTPKSRPIGFDEKMLWQPEDGWSVVMYYGTNNIFDKSCFFIVGDLIVNLCPTFFLNNTSYNSLMYVYSETNDILGQGVTLQKGWYAANSETFKSEPFDLNKHPVIISSELLTEGMLSEDESVVNYLQEIFPINDEITYTVKEENICKLDDELYISFAQCNHLSTNVLNNFGLLIFRLGLTSFTYDSDGKIYRDTEGFLTQGTECDITYSTGIRKIEEKYIPYIQSDYAQNDSSKPDYVKNRLAYDSRVVVEFDTTNPGDNINLDGDFGIYKVSDFVPSRDEMLEAKLTIYVNNHVFSLNIIEVDVTQDFAVYAIDDNDEIMYAVAYREIPNMVPSAGIYILTPPLNDTSNHVQLWLSFGELKTIDPKYIPFTIEEVVNQVLAALPTWEGGSY